MGVDAGGVTCGADTLREGSRGELEKKNTTARKLGLL